MKTELKNFTTFLLVIDVFMAVICIVGIFLDSDVSSFSLLLWVLIAAIAHLNMHKLSKMLNDAFKAHDSLIHWAVEGYHRKKKIFELTGDVDAEKQMVGYKMLVERMGTKTFTTREAPKTGTPVWKKAKAGTSLPGDSVIRYKDDDPRFGRVAIRDCEYITIEDLNTLPKEE